MVVTESSTMPRSSDVFILGAGFSCAISGFMPTTKEIGTALVEGAEVNSVMDWVPFYEGEFDGLVWPRGAGAGSGARLVG